MRTILSIDDDVLREVKQYADSRNIAMGKAVSELVRRGLQPRLQTRLVNGFHVVELPHGTPAWRSTTKDDWQHSIVDSQHCFPRPLSAM